MAKLNNKDRGRDIMGTLEAKTVSGAPDDKRPPTMREALSDPDIAVGSKIHLRHKDSGKPYTVIITGKDYKYGSVNYEFRHAGLIPALAATGSFSHVTGPAG